MPRSKAALAAIKQRYREFIQRPPAERRLQDLEDDIIYAALRPGGRPEDADQRKRSVQTFDNERMALQFKTRDPQSLFQACAYRIAHRVPPRHRTPTISQCMLLLTEERELLERISEAHTEHEFVPALQELYHLTVRHSGSEMPRGNLVANDACGICVEPVVRLLACDSREVRYWASRVLGQCGGETEAEDIAELMQRTTDDDVRLHSISALEIIGGKESVHALCWAAEHGSEKVRHEALNALVEIAIGGNPAPGEGLPSFSSTQDRIQKGFLPPEGSEPVAEMLERLRNDTSAPKSVRYRAETLLRDLFAGPAQLAQ